MRYHLPKRWILLAVFLLIMCGISDAQSVTKVVNTKTNNSSGPVDSWIKIETSEFIHNPVKKVILYVDNVAVKSASTVNTNLQQGSYVFALDRSEMNKLFFTFENRTREMNVSIAEEGSLPLKNAQPFTFHFYTKGWLQGSILLIVVMVILIVILVKKFEILKEASGIAKAYSLSSLQLIIWSSVIVVSIVFLSVATGSMPSITNTTLVLLGLAAVTKAAANGIGTPAGIKGQATLTGFKGLMSTDGKVKIHRLQFLAFTFLYCGIFLFHVFSSLKLPEFDQNAWILMGISSGTYGGLKTQES